MQQKNYYKKKYIWFVFLNIYIWYPYNQNHWKIAQRPIRLIIFPILLCISSSLCLTVHSKACTQPSLFLKEKPSNLHCFFSCNFWNSVLWSFIPLPYSIEGKVMEFSKLSISFFAFKFPTWHQRSSLSADITTRVTELKINNDRYNFTNIQKVTLTCNGVRTGRVCNQENYPV